MGHAASLDPTILKSVCLPQARIELVEWRWPSLLEYVRREDEFMLEMSLPPLSDDASACFPDIAPGHYSYMGTLFARLPGVTIEGRSNGGHIRVVRWVLDRKNAARLIGHHDEPGLPLLQSLLNIRSDSLRTLMRLAHRELTNPLDRSEPALEALLQLTVIELARLFERQPSLQTSGRLAAWQYRRIRGRLAAGGERPSVAELAGLCGISPRHLHRQFASLTGETISSYVENYMIKQAKDMLAVHDVPIKAIARHCGFGHANSFSRTFRRSTGLSPQQFRQRLQGPDQPI
jgi:AraC family transcriptional regulator